MRVEADRHGAGRVAQVPAAPARRRRARRPGDARPGRAARRCGSRRATSTTTATSVAERRGRPRRVATLRDARSPSRRADRVERRRGRSGRCRARSATTRRPGRSRAAATSTLKRLTDVESPTTTWPAPAPTSRADPRRRPAPARPTSRARSTTDQVAAPLPLDDVAPPRRARPRAARPASCRRGRPARRAAANRSRTPASGVPASSAARAGASSVVGGVTTRPRAYVARGPHRLAGRDPLPRRSVCSPSRATSASTCASLEPWAHRPPVRRPTELAERRRAGHPRRGVDDDGQAGPRLRPAASRCASGSPAGMPAYGSCAGMIMLADRIADGATDQQTLGGLDITVRRNAFGRQVDSFEDDLEFDGLDGAGARRLHPRAVGRGGRRRRRGAGPCRRSGPRRR